MSDVVTSMMSTSLPLPYTADTFARPATLAKF